MAEIFTDRYVYLLVVVLMAIGLYGMFAIPHLGKKVIGMVIFQTAIYIFFIEGSVKEGATAPIIDEAFGTDAVNYSNPLPHLLILTAIVVGVGVVGVAFALMQRIHDACGTLDESAVLALLTGRSPARVVDDPGAGGGAAAGEPLAPDARADGVSAGETPSADPSLTDPGPPAPDAGADGTES
ncbi:MAG: cation:proton antiporter subunit C [Acidimicrobiia bacterium]|nr:cation:proton antiporter subunit C [Acidimicrobiia bacterium]